MNQTKLSRTKKQGIKKASGLCKVTSYNKNSVKGSRVTKTKFDNCLVRLRQAFDSVSHSWLLKALRLAKLSENIVASIEKMSKLWATFVTLKGKNQTIKTDITA